MQKGRVTEANMTTNNNGSNVASTRHILRIALSASARAHLGGDWGVDETIEKEYAEYVDKQIKKNDLGWKLRLSECTMSSSKPLKPLCTRRGPQAHKMASTE
jgi:hypothetical protein